MRFTSAEYGRGLLSWRATPGLAIRIGTAPDSSMEKVWSPSLTEPAGSLVPIELQDKIQFEFSLTGPGAAIEINKFWMRLERVQNSVVFTRYFHGLPKEPIVLKHIPDYGTYHRLVVDAGSLTWDEDVVFRHLGLLVRFITGEVEGESMTTLTAGMAEDGSPTLQGEQATAREKGRFIELVAPGKLPEQAEQHAFATLGLLALALGRNLLGGIVFSERWEASPAGQNGIAVATGGAFARHASAVEFGAVNELLFRMTAGEPLSRARVLALRWYERGLRASAALDRLLSFFIGVETLIQTYAKSRAPLPVETDRQQENDRIIAAVASLGTKVVERVTRRIRGTSIREQFAFFASEHQLGAAETSRFDKTKRIRDSAVHGDAIDVDLEIAAEAETLLRAMLKAVYGVAGEFPWETNPVVHEIRLHFGLGVRPTPTDSQGSA